MRVKRFYIHVMEGDPVYWRDVDDEEQPAEFIVGRMLAAIVIFRPRFFTGSRVKRKLIPADLVDIKRLGIKVPLPRPPPYPSCGTFPHTGYATPGVWAEEVGTVTVL